MVACHLHPAARFAQGTRGLCWQGDTTDCPWQAENESGVAGESAEDGTSRRGRRGTAGHCGWHHVLSAMCRCSTARPVRPSAAPAIVGPIAASGQRSALADCKVPDTCPTRTVGKNTRKRAHRPDAHLRSTTPAPCPGRVREALQPPPAAPGPGFVTATPTSRRHRSRPAAPDTPKTHPRRADQRVRTSRVDHQKSAGHRSCQSFEPLQGNNRPKRTFADYSGALTQPVQLNISLAQPSHFPGDNRDTSRSLRRFTAPAPNHAGPRRFETSWVLPFPESPQPLGSGESYQDRHRPSASFCCALGNRRHLAAAATPLQAALRARDNQRVPDGRRWRINHSPVQSIEVPLNTCISGASSNSATARSATDPPPSALTTSSLRYVPGRYSGGTSKPRAAAARGTHRDPNFPKFTIESRVRPCR